MVDPGARRRALRLWPLGRALILIFVTALVVAGAVFWALVELLGVHRLKTEAQLAPDTLFDLVKLSFGVVAGAGALVALVVAYRRQRVDEDGALREATRLHTERFTTAVSQLGDASPAVRLGGVHALSGLADDAPSRELRQTCIDVLCAYLRLPYAPDPGQDTASDIRHEYLALREVRHTIIRLIGDHLRLAGDHPHSWQGHDFDFTNVVFDGGDWSRAQFSSGRVSFRGAQFASGQTSFDGAVFDGGRVVFDGAVFAGGQVSFARAQFLGSEGGIFFRNTRFSGGAVSFAKARFAGSVILFDHAVFASSEVFFHDAVMSGSRVIFTGAVFSGGRVVFDRAKLSGGLAWFSGAEFSGSTVSLDGQFYDGEVSFDSAKFSDGEVSFLASFAGASVDFTSAEFSGGRVSFSGTFSGGRVSFYAADFSGGQVSFAGAEFSGGRVDLKEALGDAPENLLPSDRV